MLTTREMSIHWVNSENLLTHDAFHQVDGQRLSDARIDQVVVRQKNDVGPDKNKLVFLKQYYLSISLNFETGCSKLSEGPDFTEVTFYSSCKIRSPYM